MDILDCTDWYTLWKRVIPKLITFSIKYGKLSYRDSVLSILGVKEDARINEDFNILRTY